MTDKDVETSDKQEYGADAPWWADLGPRGAVVLIALGGLVAAWAVAAPSLGLGSLPFIPDNLATALYQAGTVVAIGVVILVSALLNRRREGKEQVRD
ncbi:hypothetical protein [Streptomyces sp. NPDC056464]|uniref:hypothetical protein n=1 Tax=Streptomyces sp. NPDC056464 TaxID=3345828 RepID=UPI003693A359